jgi:TetR/AcrR family transcriptional regulator
MPKAAAHRSRATNATRPRTRGGRRAAVAVPTDDTTRGKILATALQVFAERGFDGARTREIAERAGANLGLITYYFGNKEVLWREAVASAFGELQHELADAMAAHATRGEREQLQEVARHFVRFVARKPEFMRLMNDEGKHDSPRMRWLADRFVQPMQQALRQLIERAQARGLLPRVSPVSLHYIMLGAAGLVFSQAAECRRIMGVDPTNEAFADAHADAVVRLFVAAT